MHELSVMAYMLERVESHADRLGATKVIAINLVVGERSSFVDDSLLFYFEMLTPGTRAEGALLNLRRTLMRCHCPPCDTDFHPTGADFRCPRCDTVGQVTDDGTELLIESLEVVT
ncbi:MAG: hydrogenase maturation nickel metallochaperone HypA [Chloroflexota bacterium]|nr:hydrogenase maturation nickel metallochaperone HypA [Chloroflexota bacterium]